MKVILFQGDSITDVGRSREYDDQMGMGYPTLVAGELGFLYPEEYKFLNRGIGGNRIVDLYARIKDDIINLKPNVVSILIGVNDVWHEIDWNNGVSVEKFYTIYKMLLEEIIESLPNTKILILEPFVLEGKATKDNWGEFRTEVLKRAEAAKRIAEEFKCKFVPLQEKLDDLSRNTQNELWTSDGVHPTIAGHEMIKREWLKAFSKIQDEIM